MNAELIYLVNSFPEQKDKIQDLYEKSDEFQTLCLDYFLCFRSLNQWEESRKKDDKFIEEYAELKRALETQLF